MRLRHVYLILCFAGTILPYWELLPFLHEYGLDLPLIVRETAANRVAAFFAMDVIVSAIVLWVFVFTEGRGSGVRHLWAPIVATLLVGVSLGLPLSVHARTEADAMIFAFFMAVAADAASPSVITDALRQRLAGEMPHEIRTLECPEGPEETKGSFECRGVMVDGQRFTVRLERQPGGLIQPKIVLFAGPEFAVREFIQPWLPGAVREFDCPDEPAPGPFTCRGTAADGSTFTVAAEKKTEVTDVHSITYDASRKSPFITALAAYAGGGSSLTSVICPTPIQKPETAFDCEVRTGNAPPKTIRVTRQPDGTLVPTAVVTPHTPSKLIRGIGVGLMLLGMVTMLVAVMQILRVSDQSVVVRLPLAAEHTIRFDSPAAYVLQLEGPHFTTVFAGLQYSMIENATGREVTTFPIILRSTRSGFSQVRMSIRRFFVENAGDHTLRVTGLREDRVRPEMGLVFSKSWPIAGYVGIAAAAGAGLMMVMGLFAFLAG